MLEPRLLLYDVYNKEVDIRVADLISYKKSYNATDIRVKDDSMEQGKRFYILSITFEGLEALLNTDPPIIN